MVILRYLWTIMIRATYIVARVALTALGALFVGLGCLRLLRPSLFLELADDPTFDAWTPSSALQRVVSLGFATLGLLMVGTPELWGAPRRRAVGGAVLAVLVVFCASLAAWGDNRRAIVWAVIPTLGLSVYVLDRWAEGWPFNPRRRPGASLPQATGVGPRSASGVAER